MALVESLRRLAALPESTRQVVIAQLDHRLRPDSLGDVVHVMSYAMRHNLTSRHATEDIAKRARDERISVEEAGRNARYELFTQMAEEFGASYVLTAHTQNDQVETVMMRILRGTGRAGLAGIPAARDIFVRPLLGVTHTQTVDYCRMHGVEFIEDPTNADTKYFRNRVRHEILPELRAIFPAIYQALLRIAANSRRDQASFAAATEEWHRRCVVADGEQALTIRIAGFGPFDDETAARFMRDVCNRHGWSHDLGSTHYKRLVELLRDDRTGSSADMPGFSARREHDALVLRRAQFACKPLLEAHQLVIPGKMHVGGKWILDSDYVPVEEARRAIAAGEAGNDVAYFDADALGAPLVVSAPRPGDRMRPLGMTGHKKLSDLFIDRKVPRRFREWAILIKKDETIHWVLGLGTSEESRIQPGTKRALRLRVTPA